MELRSDSEVIRYSGTRTFRRYWTPTCESSQKVGWTWVLPLKLSSTDPAIVAFGQAELGSLCPVDGKLESRQIRWLLHPHIHGPTHMADFFGNRGGDLLVAGQVTAQHLDIEWSRQSKVNGLADDVRRKKIKRHAGKIAIEREAQIPDIIGCRPVSGFAMRP